MPRLSYEGYKLVRIYNAIFIDLCAEDKKLNNFFIKNAKMHVLREKGDIIETLELNIFYKLIFKNIKFNVKEDCHQFWRQHIFRSLRWHSFSTEIS